MAPSKKTRCSKGTHKTKSGCKPNTSKSMKKKPTAYITYSKSLWKTHKEFLTAKLKKEGMASVNAWVKTRYMTLQKLKKLRGKVPTKSKGKPKKAKPSKKSKGKAKKSKSKGKPKKTASKGPKSKGKKSKK